MASESILAALKSQTQRLHSQLESHVDVMSRLQSRNAYQQLLTAFYGFYVPLEEKLLGCGDLKIAGIDLKKRRKVPLLIADLKHFNAAISELPIAEDLPEISSVAEGFGCLYVLEGATLGSQIIKRLLVQQLSISADNGGAFFNAYGDSVVDMWHSFRESLAAFSANDLQAQEIMISTAQQTFLKLDAWFVRCLH